MIETKDVIEFFDRLAPAWDAGMIRNEAVIAAILDNAGVSEGARVLDVACGTGVLIPDYLRRGVSSVTGIDISPRMAEIARTKYPQEKVTILCGDAESADLGAGFDCIVIYNALPHFPDPERLIAGLAVRLRPGGTLTAAHGMSRAQLSLHHRGTPDSVSAPLPTAEELAAVFAKYLRVTAVISDDRMFQVAGRLL